MTGCKGATAEVLVTNAADTVAVLNPVTQGRTICHYERYAS